MIYQKCKHCGMEWHGFNVMHELCKGCKEAIKDDQDT